MLAERELWIAANMVLQRHGDGAADFIASRIADLERQSDRGGADVWQAITRKLILLQRAAWVDGESVQ